MLYSKTASLASYDKDFHVCMLYLSSEYHAFDPFSTFISHFTFPILDHGQVLSQPKQRSFLYEIFSFMKQFITILSAFSARTFLIHIKSAGQSNLKWKCGFFWKWHQDFHGRMHRHEQQDFQNKYVSYFKVAKNKKISKHHHAFKSMLTQI